MPFLRSSAKLVKTLDSSYQSPQAKSDANPGSVSPSPEPASQSTLVPPSLRRSLRLSSSSVNSGSSPSCGMSSAGRNGKRKSDSGVLSAKGENRGVDDLSVSKKKPSMQKRSKGVEIEGWVGGDVNFMQGGEAVPKVSERNEPEEKRLMRLRSGSSISKRKTRDEENDSNKVEPNEKIEDDSVVKRRLGRPKETKSTNLVEEIRENVNEAEGSNEETMNLEKIDSGIVQMTDEKKEGVERGMSLRSVNKLKGKEKLVIDTELHENAENDPRSKRKFSYEEKGKGKMVIEADSDSDSDNLSDVESEGEKAMTEGEIGNVLHVDEGLVAERYQNFAERKSMSRREADRNKAIELAPKYAFFKDEEGGESRTDDDSVLDSGIDDWPGPFSTAMKIIREREAKLEARKKNCFKTDESTEVKISWVPSRDRKLGSLSKNAPSLKSLCMKILVDNADEIESLEGIPDVIKSKIVTMLCDSRKMNSRFLSQLTEENPAEICVSDCSWVTEKGFQEIFSNFNSSNLQELKLDLCGRCLPDYILCSTLARAPNCLPLLTKLSLKGAYSLSDDGLAAIISSAPLLTSVNLSHCSFLTSNGIIDLVSKLGPVIRELYMDECQNVSAMAVLPSLKKVKLLEVLSMAGIPSVCDRFVCELIPACGSSVKKLAFASCLKLTASSIKVIGENCPNLLDLDIRNLNRLNDSAIAHLASGSGAIQKLQLRRNSFSDEAVAAFIEASGANLIELSLNNVEKVGHHTAIAIYRKCRILQSLDLSFCRKLSDEALGLIVDTCLSLRIVKLFGCTQIKGHFLDSHSNSSVKVLGLSGNILDQFEVPDFM